MNYSTESMTVPGWLPVVVGAVQGAITIAIVWALAERVRFWKRFARVIENRLIGARKRAGRVSTADALLKRWMTWSFKLGVANPLLDELEQDTDAYFTEKPAYDDDA